MMFGKNYQDRDQYYDRAFNQRASWTKKFALLPRRCALTDKIIWLKWAYEGVAVWTGPGDNVYEYRWHNLKGHLLWLLRDKL